MASFSPLPAIPVTPPIKLEVQEAFSWLRIRHDLDVKIRWSHGRKRGVYLAKDHLILLGDNMNCHVDSLLHQVAHVIVKSECLEAERHGLNFLETLWKLVVDYYYDPKKFSWWSETEDIFTFGKTRCRQLEWES